MQIREGLIGVPPKMLNTVVRMVAREVLWWARDRLKGQAKEMPQHARELKILAAQYWPEGIPKTAYPSIEKEPLRVRKYPVDLSGLGGQYGDLHTNVEHYLVAVDWRGRRSAASWNPNRHAVIVSPLSSDWVARFPERRAEETLSGFIRHLTNCAEHELRHAVQSLVLEPRDPNQTRLNTGYGAHNPNDPKSLIQYYLSPIEFDPTIGSCALEFVEEMRLHESYGKKVNLGKAIRTYVGMIEAKTFTTDFRTAPFFMVLRKYAKRKYAIAVKKFVAEVTRLLDPMTEMMMESQLCEGVIPDTRYGYWIDADGRFHVVPFQGHMNTLWEHGIRTYAEAYEKGWVRVVACPTGGRVLELVMKFYSGTIGIKTSIAAKSLIRQGFPRYVMDILVGLANRRKLQSKVFTEAGPAIAAIDEARKRKNLAEVYREEDGGTFTHDGQEYDLNRLFELLDDSEAYEVPLDVLDWVLEWDEADPARLKNADTTKPVIVTWWFDEEENHHRLCVIDGLHRVKKALDSNMDFITGHYVDADDLEQCRVDLTEADKGGELSDTHEWGEVQKMSFDPRQGELFDGSRYEHQGSFDGYDVATVVDDRQSWTNSYTYVVFRSGTPVAYAELVTYMEVEDDTDIPADDCYSVAMVRVGQTGLSLAPRLYAWLVNEGHIDRLYGDDMQTDSGASIWRKMLNRSDVRLFMDRDGGIRPITTPEQLEEIYQHEEARVFATRRES